MMTRLVSCAALAALLLLPATPALAADDRAVGLAGTIAGFETYGPDDAGEMQTTPNFVLGTPLTAFWSPTPNEALANISRHETRLDGGAYTAQGGTVPRAEYTWLMPQASLTLGAHTLGVRACNPTECGPESTFTFNIVRPSPSAVPGLGVRPGQSIALNVPRAFDYVNAWSLWAIDRYPTAEEYSWLVAQHGNRPITKSSVARVLEDALPYLALR